MPLAGKQIQPRDLAAFAADAFLRDDPTRPAGAEELVEAVAICLAESLGFDHAFHDNTNVVTAIRAGTVVCNQETLQKFTVLDPSAGLVQALPEDGGAKETWPLTTTPVVSRDVGLWEISIPASSIGTAVEHDLYDPAKNADAMVNLRRARGWQPWVSFTTTTYLFDGFIGRASRGVGNYLAGLLLDRPAHKTDGTPIEHTWTQPVLAYQFQVSAGVSGINVAESKLGWTAKSKVQVTEIHQGLAATVTAMKQPHP